MHAEALYNYIEGGRGPAQFYGAGANNLPPIVSIGYNNMRARRAGAIRDAIIWARAGRAPCICTHHTGGVD